MTRIEIDEYGLNISTDDIGISLSIEEAKAVLLAFRVHAFNLPVPEDALEEAILDWENEYAPLE